MNMRIQLAALAIFSAMQCDLAVAQNDLIDDPDSAWELLLTAARYEADSMEGIVNYKVIQVSPGVGPKGLENVEYFLINEETGRWDKLHPATVQQMQVEATTRASAGMDKEAFADALDEGSVGVLLFGGLMESQLASLGAGNASGYGMMQRLFRGGPDQFDGSTCEMAQEFNNAKHKSTGVGSVEAHLSPLAMMSEMSCFLLIGADMLRTEFEASDQSSLANRAEVRAVADEIEYRGRTEYGNESAYLLAMDDLGISEPTDDGGVVNIDEIRSWISTTHLNQIAVMWSGTWIEDGESRDISIGKINSDFRTVPGTNMIRPYRTTTTMGGFMTAEQQQEIQEAAQQLDEFERQMAAMPADQRQMMQSMMGSQLESIRALATSGSFEFTLVTKRILVNTDVLSGEAAFALGDPKVLIQEIQYDLHTLGYEPGNYAGEVDKATVAAIIKFQRDYKQELTGEPTPELGRILSATVSSLN